MPSSIVPYWLRVSLPFAPQTPIPIVMFKPCKNPKPWSI